MKRTLCATAAILLSAMWCSAGSYIHEGDTNWALQVVSIVGAESSVNTSDPGLWNPGCRPALDMICYLVGGNYDSSTGFRVAQYTDAYAEERGISGKWQTYGNLSYRNYGHGGDDPCSDSYLFWGGGLLGWGTAGCQFSWKRVGGGTNYPPDWVEKPDPVRPDRDNAESIDPINTISGGMVHEETDIVIPCPGVNLEFSRFYNSQMSSTNGFSPRWGHSYSWTIPLGYLSVGYLGDVVWYSNMVWVVRSPDGSEMEFMQFATNMWYCSRESHAEFRENAQYDHDLLFKGGSTLHFTVGRLDRISDKFGNFVSISYSNYLPIRAEHNNGLYLNFTYDSNKLVRLDSPNTNLYVTYAYNDRGELTNATRHTSAGDEVRTYAYDAEAGYTSHCMTQRVNAAGDVYRYGYAMNAGGQITGYCTNLALSSNYYSHAVNCYTNQSYSTLTYFRDGTSRPFDYLYHSTYLRVTNIVGPTTDQVQSFLYDPNFLTLTNVILRDKALNEYLSTSTLYDNHYNPTNVGSAYNTAPTNFWQYAYTNQDLLAWTIDPEGGKAEFEYTNALISRSRFYYNSTSSYDMLYSYTTNGLLSCVTNANGHWSKFYYDSYGRVDRIEPQTGPCGEYSNNILGYLETITVPGDNGSRVTTLERDEIGLVKKVTYANSQFDIMSYDAAGRVTNYVDIAGRHTGFEYLPDSRLCATRRFFSSGAVFTNRLEYDNQFNGLRIIDAKDRAVETYVMDLQDRATSITNLEGHTMSVTYGVADIIRKVVRFDGTSVSNDFNSDGLLCKVTLPGSTNTFSYYRDGALRMASDESGTISNQFNMLGLLIRAEGIGPTAVVEYAYNPGGNISNVTSVAGSVKYSYDEAERILAVESGAGTFQPTFNTNNGRVASVVCTNNGLTVDYLRDIMDFPTNITWRDNSSNVIASFDYSYSSAFMITQKVSRVGSRLSTEFYEYDEYDRLTREKCVQGTNVTRDVSYVLDQVGNRQSKTSQGVTVDYSFSNGCDRLLGWTATSTNNFADLRVVSLSGNSSKTIGTNSALGYLYVSNSVGTPVPVVIGTNFSLAAFLVAAGTNSIVAAVGDVAGNVGYATNTITMVVVTNAGYQFNAAGCVTNINYIGGCNLDNMALAWNSSYELTEVRTNGVLAEKYEYDVGGRRTVISDGATTNYLVYDRAQLIAETDCNGSLIRSYVWGGGVDNLLALTVHTGAVAKTYYPVKDHLSVVAIVDETGSIVEQYEFDAWGRVLGVYSGQAERLSQSAIGNRFLWQCREYSWATGLYHFRTRFYDPVSGRWLSNDPIGVSGGLNQYTFCGNNPVNCVDPDGQFWSLAVNLAFVAFDTFQAATGQISGAEYGARMGLNLACLALDAASAGMGPGAALRVAYVGVRVATVATVSVHTVQAATKANAATHGILQLAQFARQINSYMEDRCSDRGAAKNISTGRTTPQSLKEQLAMEQVKAKPSGTTPSRMPKMTDTKNNLLHEDGWVKRVQNVNDVEIHYVENINTGEVLDFKFAE
ncbi:MAG: hypothetical protein C0404_13350 [Verrucomicrobia bacterium]|nr:hypothetical protein [Verrucomicrobiota bacterium]